MRKAVFLDRDGTVIRDMVYLNDPHQIFFFEESFPALKMLHDAGYLLLLVTNQSGVARGLVQLANLHRINKIIQEKYEAAGIPIAGIYYCAHAVDAGCQCRKPKPGMLKEASQKFQIDLGASWMVGDRMSDVEAGKAAGCKSVLLSQTGTVNESAQMIDSKWVCGDLLEAASFILKTDSPAIA